MPGSRVAPVCVVFDGQSLNNVAGLSQNVNTYPIQLMANYTHPFIVPAINGASWTDLTLSQSGRTLIHANAAATTILIMCGGTQDVLDGDTGAQIYADEVAYAAAAVAAGFDFVLGSTISPATGFTAGENTRRTDHNTLILADASNAFDGVADFCASPLDDASNTTYYVDGTHWTVAGCAAAAAKMKVVLDAIL